MLDMNLIEEYIEENFPNSVYNNKYKRETFNLIRKFFNSTEIDYDNLTSQDILNIYSQLAIVKANVFQTHKSKISSFMNWMYKSGNGSNKPLEEIKDIFFENIDRTVLYDTYYFRDLDDLNNLLINGFGREVCDFSTFHNAAILVWHGIPVKHLPDILKTDVSDDGYVTDPVTKGRIQLSQSVMPCLLHYRDADTFDSEKFGGRTVPYKKTQYLFRTYKTSHMTAAQLINTSAGANRIIDETSRIFQWKRIYDSGLYYRIYEYEKQNGNVGRNDYELLRKLFETGDIDLKNSRQRHCLAQKYDEYQEFKSNKYSCMYI